MFIDDWTPPSFRRSDIGDYITHEEDFQFIQGTPRERILRYLSWLDDYGRQEIMKLALTCRSIILILPDVTLENPLDRSLFQYLCVKSKKMLRYPQYKDINKLIDLGRQDDAVQTYIKYITNETSHVSIKFNQALHTLRLIERFPDCRLIKFYNSLFSSRKEKIAVSLATLKIYISEAIELTRDNTPQIYLNPPAIFENFIMLKTGGKEGLVDMETISSGEYQKIGLLSSIIYHLKNIDSIQEGIYGKANKYERVLLMLDEIELYFHPDFQRTLVNELLKKIALVKFEQIKAINILFITHSPFVLSDIPKDNVLFIEDGEQKHPMSENTFGANIHTLLQHGFFLKGVLIGEFAKDKINELFDVLNQQVDLNMIPDLERRILMVSEPFLRSQLLKSFHERTSTKNIDTLLKRIDHLENIINDRDK